MTTQDRIITIAEGVTSEIIAEQTHLFYDPASGSGSVSFQYRRSLYVNGAWQSIAGEWQVLQADVASIASECYGTGTDPVTGADLSKISTAGMMAIIKAAFAAKYDASVPA